MGAPYGSHHVRKHNSNRWHAPGKEPIEALRKGRLTPTTSRLSAVNSINLARILAQCVYYIHAYQQLPEGHKDSVRYVVPTGNFGNVLAGWLAGQMGLPAEEFTVATNQNDLLYRLFTEGIYEPKKVNPSLAPSMDIQVASNFERFLHYHLDGDGQRTSEKMNEIILTK